jgi:hypothetical protein
VHLAGEQEEHRRRPFAANPIACFVALRRVSESSIRRPSAARTMTLSPAPK